MAKEDIQKMIDDASKALDGVYDDQVNVIKSEIKSFKTKTVEKISKSTP
jgi:hypothetical protein